MATTETFKLSELRLDQQNYRIGPVGTQRDALKEIIEDQKSKLANLAEDILAVGLSPGEQIWVTRDLNTKGSYVVLEGNRRVAALKLLETPALADGTEVEKAFHSLAKTYAENPIREIEARVFGSREEARPWQRRRHMTSTSGVGLQGWKPLAKARANRDHGDKTPRFLAVVDLLQDDSDEWETLADLLDSKWTTVDRVLNASSMPKTLGVDIDPKTGITTFENGDEEAGKNLLRRVLSEVASPDFAFALIEKDVDRDNFINRFAALSVKTKPGTVSTAGAGGAKSVPPRSAAPAAASAKRLTVAPRQTLAPKNGAKTFHVNGDRLNSLYRECRHIQLKGNENASAFLLRVFIELSSETFLVEKKVPIPASAKGKTNWDDFGIALSIKVACVLAQLDSTGRAKQFQQTRLSIDPSSHSVSSINSLHGYFHNRLLKPDATAVREAWDAWEIYLRELHNNR